MNNNIQSFESNYYQPNIFIAILLGLYLDWYNIFTIDISENPTDIQIENFVKELESAFNVNGVPLVKILKDSISIKITINQHDSVLDTYGNKIECKKFIENYLKKYTDYFERELLEDEFINRPSWKTLSTRFINSIDKECNLNNYKIFTLEHMQVITTYCFKRLVYLKQLIIRPIIEENTNLHDYKYWKVRCILSVKPLIRMLNGKIKEHKVKYSAREQQLLDYIETYSENKISPEDLLDIIIPGEDFIEYSSKKKYLSNFISRLNKKFLANTGYKRFSGKVFNDVYKIEFIPEEN